MNPTVSRWLDRIYVSVLVLELVWLTWRYSTTPVATSDPLSVGLGWGGLISMVVMLIYSIARRSKAMRRAAPLRDWLHFHIFCGLQGVLMVFFHCLPWLTSASPGYFLNPGVLNFLAVAIVFASGLFGRYLYGMLPRAQRGEQMSARDVEAELREFDAELPADVQALCFADWPTGGGFVNLIREDWRARAALRALNRLDLAPRIVRLATRSVRLRRRYAALATAQPWFELWIVAHRPIAAIMFVLSAVHVALSYLFGA